MTSEEGEGPVVPRPGRGRRTRRPAFEEARRHAPDEARRPALDETCHPAVGETRRRIQILDTTLRDGEQAPGFSMNLEEKLVMASQLARLGVDCIEAGFAASSPEDFEAIRRIATEVGGGPDSPVIAALARCCEYDVAEAARALSPAHRGRIHVFIATSSIHLTQKLGLSPGEALGRAIQSVRTARDLGFEVEFSAEDAFRSDPIFLREIFAAVCEVGASVVNVPDTVGYALPDEVGTLFSDLARSLPQALLSFHGHDDLGLAVANTLAAIQAGASQVEVTVNGIGERAGNAALEEVVMAVETRLDRLFVSHGVTTEQLFPTSRRLGHITGVGVQPNKAIVGDNAFSHEAGIHQHGVLASPETYEIMRPEDIGRERSPLVLGKHSGRHAVAERLTALGVDLDSEDLSELMIAFKDLAVRKRRVYDDDLLLLVSMSWRREESFEGMTLDYLNVTSGTGVVPTATVVLARGDERMRASSVGDGPLDAVFRALGSAAARDLKVLDYRARAASPGADAVAEVTVRARRGATSVLGRGHSIDTVEAGALAVVDLFNREDRLEAFATRERSA